MEEKFVETRSEFQDPDSIQFLLGTVQWLSTTIPQGASTRGVATRYLQVARLVGPV